MGREGKKGKSVSSSYSNLEQNIFSSVRFIICVRIKWYGEKKSQLIFTIFQKMYDDMNMYTFEKQKSLSKHERTNI